jgi:hypothetical protein
MDAWESYFNSNFIRVHSNHRYLQFYPEPQCLYSWRIIPIDIVSMRGTSCYFRAYRLCSSPAILCGLRVLSWVSTSQQLMYSINRGRYYMVRKLLFCHTIRSSSPTTLYCPWTFILTEMLNSSPNPIQVAKHQPRKAFSSRCEPWFMQLDPAPYSRNRSTSLSLVVPSTMLPTTTMLLQLFPLVVIFNISCQGR